MPKMRLLLLSNSQNKGQEYLGHAEGAIKDFLGGGHRRALFVPFAQVVRSDDSLASRVTLRFRQMGYHLESVAEAADPRAAVMDAEAIVVSGGNTFQLLHSLQQAGLLESIRARVRAGVPYVGWSAGANIACPTIRTTNDMPIVEPRSFKALGLVPFQINPHYVDERPSEEYVESREDRINEFIEVNPGVYVAGLREGSILWIDGSSIELSGAKGARVFFKGRPAADYNAGDSVQFLLDQPGRP